MVEKYCHYKSRLWNSDKIMIAVMVLIIIIIITLKEKIMVIRIVIIIIKKNEETYVKQRGEWRGEEDKREKENGC